MCRVTKTKKRWAVGVGRGAFAAALSTVFVMSGPALAEDSAPFCDTGERECRVVVLTASDLRSERAGQGPGLDALRHPGWEYAVTLWDELKIAGKNGDSQPRAISGAQNVRVTASSN